MDIEVSFYGSLDAIALPSVLSTIRGLCGVSETPFSMLEQILRAKHTVNQAALQECRLQCLLKDGEVADCLLCCESVDPLNTQAAQQRSVQCLQARRVTRVKVGSNAGFFLEKGLGFDVAFEVLREGYMFVDGHATLLFFQLLSGADATSGAATAPKAIVENVWIVQVLLHGNELSQLLIDADKW
eukprot:CAMPEP_0119316670 /NCGR_PEP_ID=MMETSP1333-20130426/40393_1 /TAXON_ID=418940 /ORGANISM="Scyphosphaera apsteinii, Strain RCC1455" /LENGTH=184 /DNA_ID=CAMNT_0007322373 /DNA_START=84 /DNA_END=635 /DNA_ORIENTATION=-